MLVHVPLLGVWARVQISDLRVGQIADYISVCGSDYRVYTYLCVRHLCRMWFDELQEGTLISVPCRVSEALVECAGFGWVSLSLVWEERGCI